MLDEALRQHLVDLLGHQRVHQEYVPDSPKQDYVWFTQDEVTYDDCLEAVAQVVAVLYSVECWAPDLSTSQAQADTISTNLHRYGPNKDLGGVTVQIVNIETTTDDYLPRGGFEDRPWFWTSFQIEIVP